MPTKNRRRRCTRAPAEMSACRSSNYDRSEIKNRTSADNLGHAYRRSVCSIRITYKQGNELTTALVNRCRNKWQKTGGVAFGKRRLRQMPSTSDKQVVGVPGAGRNLLAGYRNGLQRWRPCRASARRAIPSTSRQRLYTWIWERRYAAKTGARRSPADA